MLQSIISKSLPAIQAFIKAEMFPASIAYAAVLTRNFDRFGANTVNVAISIPTVLKFA